VVRKIIEIGILINNKTQKNKRNTLFLHTFSLASAAHIIQ
jgi:hypothetical protein